MICNAGEGSIFRTALRPGRIGQFVEPETRGDPFGKIFVDMPQVTDHRLAYVQMLDLRKLEHQRRRDMRLLVGGLAEIELPRLAVVVGEALGTDAALLAGFVHRGAMKALGGVSRGELSDRELGS